VSVALISAVDPYPTDAGKKVVLAGFVDYLADRHGADNVHYIKVGTARRENFPVQLHEVPGPRRVDVLRNVAARVATGRASLQEAFLGSRQTMEAITQILEDIKPGLRIYDTVRMAQYASDDIAANSICYLDDLFSERYDRMLKAAARYPDVELSPLGNFAEHVPKRLQPLATHRVSQSALLRLERRLVLRSEDRAARRFGRCLLLNSGETAQLQRRTGVAPGRIQCVPPLLNIVASSGRTYRGTKEFIFLGLLSLPHNEDGLESFLRTAWPLVLARMPDAHLTVIGRDASPRLLALTAELAGSVTVAGYVPDLDDALNGAAALINPLRFGSGIKLKVFEALRRSLPVISTTVGAEGIDSGPGTGILIADDAAATADLLCSLTSVERNAEVSDEAREHFASTYSRDAVFAVYDRAFTL
jgi:glycosyltransferase involved in cell wall biosynthesis